MSHTQHDASLPALIAALLFMLFAYGVNVLHSPPEVYAQSRPQYLEQAQGPIVTTAVTGGTGVRGTDYAPPVQGALRFAVTCTGAAETFQLLATVGGVTTTSDLYDLTADDMATFTVGVGPGGTYDWTFSSNGTISYLAVQFTGSDDL